MNKKLKKFLIYSFTGTLSFFLFATFLPLMQLIAIYLTEITAVAVEISMSVGILYLIVQIYRILTGKKKLILPKRWKQAENYLNHKK